MTLSLLDHFLLSQLFAFLLIFTRIGSAIMIFPALGDAYVSARIRLLFALSLSLLLTPLLQTYIPTMPTNALALTILLVSESAIGLAIGLIIRIILSAAHVAGTIIAFQSSLSAANLFDPNSGGQSTVVSNFLLLMATVIFLQLDLHHVLFEGLVSSYTLFPTGEFPNVGDFSELSARAVADAFTMGTRLAAPHIAFGLIFYVGGGIMGRLMPQMQVFYVLMSGQIMAAFFLLIAILSGLFYVYMDHVNEAIFNLFALD